MTSAGKVTDGVRLGPVADIPLGQGRSYAVATEQGEVLHQHAFDLQTGCSPSGQPPLVRYDVQVDDEGQLLLRLPNNLSDHRGITARRAALLTPTKGELR